MSETRTRDETVTGAQIRNNKLIELYHRYVSDSASKRDVYGYWTFLLGCVLGLGGVLVYQVEQALFPGNLAVREVAIALAAVALPVGLLGIVVLLPVRRRGMQASLFGFAVSMAGIAGFVSVYPHAWYVSPDYSPEIIAVYTVGITVIAGVAVLVPVVTGEKGLLVDPELGFEDDRPPILIGETSRDAMFSIYDRDGEWTWRIVQRDAIGRAAEPVPTDTDARVTVDEARVLIGDAGLLEITTAAFRLYRTDGDGWKWSLVRDDGGVLATSAEPYSGRDDVEDAVSFLKESAAEAGVLDVRDAAFDRYEANDRWHWRLVDEQRRPLAKSVTGYADEGAATAEMERFVDRLETARVLEIDPVGFELDEREDGWRWTVVDADDATLAGGTDAHESRRGAERAATAIADELDAASRFESGTAGFERYPDGDGWRWRLRDAADEIVAASHGPSGPADDAEVAIERTRDAVETAEIVEFEGADYEVYPAAGDWHWRLVAADRTVLADSSETFRDRDVAREAAERVREAALAADLVEFEQAAFQQYESDGEWRWRLIDEDGRVMADSGEQYASKGDVREGMTTLKEHAPDAEVLEIETAAFEIYRTEGGEYEWRLIDDAGHQVAESAGAYASRGEAREAVDFLLERFDGATVRTMDRPVFQLEVTDDEWVWLLVHQDGTVLAEGTAVCSTRDDANTAIERVREAGSGAPTDAFDPYAVQLLNGGDWRWRILDPDRAVVAEGERRYGSLDAAEADVRRLVAGAADAPVFELGDGVIRIETDDGEWRWRLADETRTTVAVSADAYDSRDAVEAAIEGVRARAPDADVVEFDTAAFELFRDDGGWRWRLIDENGTSRAVGTGGYEDRNGAREVVGEVRETAAEASVIEIEDAAFELHDRDDGWIWRLVDGHGNGLAESAVAHDTRADAREELRSVKEHAPSGETVVAG